jgi:hypothetical protein
LLLSASLLALLPPPVAQPVAATARKMLEAAKSADLGVCMMTIP